MIGKAYHLLPAAPIFFMARFGWKSPKEYRVELPTKHYYFEILDHDRGQLVQVKEWRKSRGLKRSETQQILIFDNHLRDVLKGLLKVMKRLKLDVADILAKYQETDNQEKEDVKP